MSIEQMDVRALLDNLAERQKLNPHVVSTHGLDAAAPRLAREHIEQAERIEALTQQLAEAQGRLTWLGSILSALAEVSDSTALAMKGQSK